MYTSAKSGVGVQNSSMSVLLKPVKEVVKMFDNSLRTSHSTTSCRPVDREPSLPNGAKNSSYAVVHKLQLWFIASSSNDI
ncbi:hypothetical protein ACTXT7_004808 [Hymenolepis weldensis]